MKVIIAGSRTIDDYDLLCKTIDNSGIFITEVVSGGASGVDKLGERYAKENYIPLTRFPVTKEDWNTHGKKAGMLRNIKMGDYAEGAIILWDGISKGSLQMIQYAKKKGLKLIVEIVE